MVSAGQQCLEDPARLIMTPNRGQGIDIPERADCEGGRWRAEVVGRSISQQVAITPEMLTYNIVAGGQCHTCAPDIIGRIT